MGDQPQAKRAPAPPAGPRGKTRAPRCFSGSLLSASWELGAPRHPGACGQGAPQRFAAAVARVPRCSTPRPGSAFFVSSGRAGVWGARQGPRLAPPGLRGPEPESPRRTPSLSGFQSGAPSVPQRRAPAQPAFPESTARPLFPARVCAAAAPAPGRLSGSFARPPLPWRSPNSRRSGAAPAGGGAAAPAAPPSRRGRGHLGPLPVASVLGPAPSSRGRRQPRRGPWASHRAVSGRHGCGEPGAEMPRGGSGCEPSPGGSASQRTRAPLATSVTLQEPGPEPRRRRYGPARAARSVLPTSGAGAGCGASGQLVASRLSPPAPRELAGGNSARPL